MKQNDKIWKIIVDTSIHSNNPRTFTLEDFPLNIEGNVWKAYEVSVSHRDLFFYCDKGTVTYLVDTYGDKHSAVLHDWYQDQ